ncbi:phycobilisome Linker polypeptide [Neosynechococcus sphagnicola sy1]|uniref:Phycobilisome Linker polypeptide n=1 Tax=Neosynechococcus sphagnicola sy1 TaxID=1497020 RepID=A0A098TJR9_9CYAN|nr:phycobilisome rod-core linker polypeptide [Neosynechococcus sphagnicola]KGF72551.1 phycobilisome Linker polypeptide [Neosynechococcus sphagnicola sy1]
MTKSMTVSRRSTLEERQAALYQIYQQVLERQPYHSERRVLAQVEADFLKDKIGVRRFLKELGHSEVYLNAFYHRGSNLKFLEWCFKHFMGRAPLDQQEMQAYCNILMHQGVGKVITSILDSEEYRKVFGCFTVPYAREKRYYSSPKAYLESQMLNHEHFSQRGRVVPTLYWHQLGLNCDAGVCRHPEANEVLEPLSSPETDGLEAEFLEILEVLGNAREHLGTAMAEPRSSVKRVIASLTPEQRDALRRAIR